MCISLKGSQPPYNSELAGKGNGCTLTIKIFKQRNMAFFQRLGLIPKGHYCEVGYDSLTADPVGQMRRI